MRRTCITAAIVATIILAPFVIGSSCTQGGGVLGTGSVWNMSAEQKQALVAAVKAAETISQSTQMVGYSSHLADERSKHNNARSIGTCPAITLTGSLSGAATLTIDFGQQPCTVPFTHQTAGITYNCSGSATGTINFATRALNLAFGQLSCNGETIDGTMDATMSGDSGLNLAGSWNLAYTSTQSGYRCATTGTGEGAYYWVQGCCDATVVSTFSGALSETRDEVTTDWTVTMTNVQISAEQYGSLVPYMGSITVTGANIGSVTVEFNENSPITGEVTITIPGLLAVNTLTFTVELSTLAEWLAGTPQAAS